MRKILVTGSLGFIGSAVVKKFLSCGHVVVGVDAYSLQDVSSTQKPYVSAIFNHHNYIHYEADICDYSLVIQIFSKEKPDIVIHLSGRTGIESSRLNPDEFFAANVVGTQNILNACRLTGCSNLVFASSVVVYGEVSEPAREDVILSFPTNPYSASKIYCERILQAYAEIYGLNVVVLRIFSIYGPGQRKETAVFKFTAAIAAGKPVVMYGDGSAKRDFLYLDDCVDGIAKAADMTSGFNIINIGGQSPTTLNELVRIISGHLGKKAIVQHIPVPQGIPDSTFANIEKAKRILGFQPTVSIDEGIKRFTLWFNTIEKI